MFRQFAGLSKVHFVGIGGAGMSGIAEVLLDYDLKVSGCDSSPSEVTRRLADKGAEVFEGHSPDHLDGVDLVVISSAVSRESEEIRAAIDRRIPVARRAEMLGELMRLKYGVAVAGTHGKTTTTSLIGAVVTDAGLDPTVIVGGRLRVSGTGARLGKSDYLVAEADEYDRSFLRLQPVIAVVTSIDSDHLDTYGDLDQIKKAFFEFAGRVPFFGEAILCLDDPNVQELLDRLEGRRGVTYGLSPQANLRAVDLATTEMGTRFTVQLSRQGDLGDVDLPMHGVHNVCNALAAVAVGLALGIDFSVIAESLSSFKGVHRRFERKGEWHGATVVDDYAHHPVEVSATLEAARKAFPQARVHAVFQPHLYSRTRDLSAEFGRALLAASYAIVTDIYPSREAPIEGVDASLVVEAAVRSGHRHVQQCADWREVPGLLQHEVREGDVILTLGAGDIYRLSELLVEETVS